MSEFYFDYKCIAMVPKTDSSKGRDKALDFYLFQDYNNGGAMCVQVYIPKSMRKNSKDEECCGVRVYLLANGVDLPHDFDLNYEFVPWSKEYGPNVGVNYMIQDDNCIFIKSDENGELSGSGVIAFIYGNDPNAAPKMEDTYKYVINYSKKDMITYRIVKHKNRIDILLIYPLIRSDIDLYVIKKNNARPVLISDRIGDNKFLKVTDNVADNCRVTITLKANEKNGGIKKKSFYAKNTDNDEYRLVFADLSNNKYYLLVDESDPIENKSSRISERKNKFKLDVHKCPYCGESMGEMPQYSKGSSQICTCKGEVLLSASEGDFDVEFDKKLKGEQTIVCGKDLTTLSKPNSTDGPFIRINNLIIPKNYVTLPTMNVVVAGAPNSGKTVYLSSLFNFRKGTNGKTDSNSFLLKIILNAFDKTTKDEKNVDEVKFSNVNITDTNGCKKATKGYDCEEFRERPEVNIKSRYVISANDKVESHTEKDEAFKLSWHPVAFKMGNLGFIYFYDVPGEPFSNGDKVRSVDMADCFLAFIDGAKGINDALKDLKEIMEKIPKMSNSLTEKEMENLPIAIVFTKLDLKLSNYLEGDEERQKGCFEENCHVVREDILGIMPNNGIYTGSKLERHIDCSSYELENFLKSSNADAATAFSKIKEKYKNIKFFTCSALGNNACLGTSQGNKKEVLFRPRRLRMELPIIWLMYQKGLIKR